ncbi:CDP-glycerol glycerophosphotransferase [Ancylomarina subtilis]|uniref:CDP-glycerol glycerophosphotransferase n=1 Tax=Ancylomarina subtilis TaxID=1639035 RepID=A0A4Q7VM62_9BACT|nr:CDP-glycerol glycerophosphotransferase family protein [Ancylomarina subtilis]RZT97359.1 CDP-glycerol glycerophosphotransferase [Ancylomarina subtilis]
MNLNKYSKPVIFLTTLLGWIFIVPLTYLIPKKRNRMVLMGAKDGFFIDNVKFFFLYLSEKETDQDFYLLTANKDTYETLRFQYSNILYYPSAKAYWIMLRSNVFVVDNFSWMDNCRFQLFWRAKIIQIWHGIGFKKIQRSNKFFIKETSSLYRRFILNFVGKLPKYQAVISTGDFFTREFFQPAFDAEHFIETGYPRNDVIVNPEKYRNSDVNSDVVSINKVAEMRKKGIKAILYAPTFRDTGGDGISDGILDLNRLNQFALENDYVFVFKLHPLPQYKSISEDFERIIWYDNVKDVYPLLPKVDGMISDYSSIYMDYILLNRPIFFLLYDREKYETKDRELHAFFNDFLVGSISTCQEKLEQDLVYCFTQKDEFIQERSKIIEKSYLNTDDNSAKRILKFIKEYYFRNN